ncbi:hypothetical protein NUKP41_50960 [Klebsiella variicola]|nr:hypothetical protein NUKP41_50960 [Klebsiella variicola]
MSRLNKIDHFIDTETKSQSQYVSQMARWGVGGHKQLLHAARAPDPDEVQLYLLELHKREVAHSCEPTCKMGG